MRIDSPQCTFRNCKYYFDGNCTNQLPYGYEHCEFNRMKDRLQIDPSGTDKIDELEEAAEYTSPIRYGKWRNEIHDYRGVYFKQCSICKKWSADCGNFCSNCGAEMMGNDDEKQ